MFKKKKAMNNNESMYQAIPLTQKDTFTSAQDLNKTNASETDQ